ncbi:MAG: aryl-sulfate sulfotransferase [Bacteroidetes bacterium]|nr:aryl-sulfate sulfotransferase [Bacteroidota bacterium]
MRTITRQFKLAALFLVFAAWAVPFSGHSQNFPPLTFVINDSAATAGYYFMSPYTNTAPFNYDRVHLILDRFGRVVFYRIFPTGGNLNATIDFQLQPDGRMSYFNINRGKFFLMDSTFTDVDSISCVHGFETDQHDFQVLPGNHYLLFGKEMRIMNLTAYHWFGINHTLAGGANAEVTGVVVQEFDESKALVWEWKGHDHYQFGDVDQAWLSTPNKVDWTHANAVERDQDGNILLSLRHFNEITKINHETGNILWRLGGKANQFSFPNDTIRFTGQHDIRRVSDTSVSLFDNGQYTHPRTARGLEYALDENNKIANLVWEYIYDSSMYSIACGNHQYIENDNHLVDFGFNGTGFPWMVVVKPDKTRVLEVYLPSGFISYRAFNYINLPWQLHRPAIACQKNGDSYFLVAEPGHTQYLWSTGAATSSIPITSTGEYWVAVPYGKGYIRSEYLAVTDITHPCLPTGVPAGGIPKDFSLTCVPNPASDKIKIMYNLADKASVVVSLVTVMGTKIVEVRQDFLPAGSHETTIDVSSIPRGTCLLSVMVDNALIARKVILLKTH